MDIKLSQITRDGHCLYNAIMEGMINKQLAIPSKWLTLNSWERGQSMRQTLTKFCNGGYRILALYTPLRKILDSQGDGDKTLFEEMLHRIQHGEYGQDSERELMALKFNITIRVYDGYSKRWIVNQEADPNGNRVITIIWDRTSTHYNLLIPEGEVSSRTDPGNYKTLLAAVLYRYHIFLKLKGTNINPFHYSKIKQNAMSGTKMWKR